MMKVRTLAGGAPAVLQVQDFGEEPRKKRVRLTDAGTWGKKGEIVCREYVLREYVRREYVLREYVLREYVRREYVLREYLCSENLLIVGEESWSIK
jgi:hypothetical protein